MKTQSLTLASLTASLAGKTLMWACMSSPSSPLRHMPNSDCHAIIWECSINIKFDKTWMRRSTPCYCRWGGAWTVAELEARTCCTTCQSSQTAWARATNLLRGFMQIIPDLVVPALVHKLHKTMASWRLYVLLRKLSQIIESASVVSRWGVLKSRFDLPLQEWRRTE